MSKEFIDLLPVILVGVFLWLGALSFVFFKMQKHFRRLVGKAPESDLVTILEKILKSEEDNKKVLHKHSQEIEKIDVRAGSYVQKLGLVRFNPFSEIGGDQSFVVCLLDRSDTGFLLTGLHTRDRTRIYVKPIKNGQSKIELSREEKKALRDAQK